MNDINKKCSIERYDVTIKEPPYLTIPIDTIDVLKPNADYLGGEFAKRLRHACRDKGYQFKFYTMSSDNKFDYMVVVY